MSYGFEVYNANGLRIIDDEFLYLAPVEPIGTPSFVPGFSTSNPTGTNIFPGIIGYTGNVADDDIIVARPLRNPADPNEVVACGPMNYGWSFLSPAVAKYGTAYYRLRKISTPAAGDYGLVVYKEDGVTPTFDSNSVAGAFDIVAKPLAPSGIAWYDLPAGENIDDYYVVLDRDNQSTATGIPVFGGSTITLIVYRNQALFDYANNRIGFRTGTGTTTFFSGGKIGKIR